VLEDLTFKSLGLVNYHETIDLMRSHIKEENFSNEIWLLEHPPIFTLGTAANKKHVLNAKDIPIVQSDRGGEVTYHGPGQLIVYFLLDIKKLDFSPNKLVSTIQNFIKELLADLSINCNFIKDSPGVYVNNKKIASVGMRISKGRSYHGISLNVDMDLKPFTYINPCGYEGLEVTQIKDFKDNITLNDITKLAIKKLESII
tara:strand:+ start:57 stop:659 length:603 start_codon:yes stop_codon:yes gene_type:complete